MLNSSDPNTPNSTNSAFDSVKGRIKRTFSKSKPHSNPPSPFDAGVGPKKSVSHAPAIMRGQQAKRHSLPASTSVGEGQGENAMHPPNRASTEDITSSTTLTSAALSSAGLGSSSSPVAFKLDTYPQKVPALPKQRPASSNFPSITQPDTSQSTSSDDVAKTQKLSRWIRFQKHFKRGK
jgi:hypothetical protein